MLYCLVTGKFPFWGNTNKEIFKEVLSGVYLSPGKSVSTDVKRILLRMICLDPMKWSTCEMLL